MNEQPDHDAKHEPAAAPSVPLLLASKVSAGVSDPESARDLRIALLVEGGAPSERYEFAYEVAGSGEATARMRNELTGRDTQSRTIELARDDFVELLRTIDVSQLLRAADKAHPIPPDSVIGRLEISDGEQRVATVFMADAEQAKDAGYEVPAAIAKAVERIYDLAAKQLDEKDVRP
jgi:hypothetical protein